MSPTIYLLEECQPDEAEPTAEDNEPLRNNLIEAVREDDVERLKEIIGKGMLFRSDCHFPVIKCASKQKMKCNVLKTCYSYSGKTVPR
jgi:hypothetical protein